MRETLLIAVAVAITVGATEMLITFVLARRVGMTFIRSATSAITSPLWMASAAVRGVDERLRETESVE